MGNAGTRCWNGCMDDYSCERRSEDCEGGDEAKETEDCDPRQEMEWWGGESKCGRWNSAERVLMQTNDFLGIHLVTKLREAVRLDYGGESVAASARHLCAQLVDYEREHRLLIKLADTGRVITALEQAMTAVLDIVDLHDSHVETRWRQQLQDERDQRLELYAELLGDEDHLRTELGDEQQQKEMQTLLKNGLKKYAEVLAPGELDTISAAFDAVVQLSGMVVMAVPDVFATTETNWPLAMRSPIAGGEEACLRETSILTALQHPNVRRFYGACHVGKEPFVIHEWTHPLYHSNFRWRRVLGCARGIHYVHERGLVHRRLTVANLLRQCSNEHGGTLSGLGLTRSYTVEEAARRSLDKQGVASEYAELEGISRQLSTANDVMALGIALFQLLARRPPKKSGCASLLTLKTTELPGSKPDFLDDDEWRLLQGMCASDPTDRLSMKSIVRQITALANQEDSRSDAEAVNN